MGTQLFQLPEETDEEDEGRGVIVPSVTQHVKKWGPVVPTRMSARIARDGKTVVEKAQELRKV